MKLYIRAVTIEELEQQYGKDPGMTKQRFKDLINLDPTADYKRTSPSANKRGKYGPWIMKQNRLGNIGTAANDLDDLRDALQLFSTDYKHYPKSDINQYKTVEEFLTDSQRVGNRQLSARELEKLHGKQAHKAGDSDKKFLCEDGDWELWTPLTYQGSIALARSGGGPQAEWCTAWTRSDSYYKSYTSRGTLYIFLNKNNTGEKYQTCIYSDNVENSCWFYNAADREQGRQAFFNFLDQHPNFKEFFKVQDTNGVRTMGETIIGYTPGVDQIIIPDGITTIPNKQFPDTCKVVILPDSVTTISDSAFRNSNVETVEFNAVTTIGKNAFEGSAIQNIDLSAVELIDNGAFRGCKNLEVANFNKTARLGAYAFADCTALNGPITLYPTTVVSSGTFNNCSNLTLIWKDDDFAYPIDGIKLLKVDMATHPQLVDTNKDYVTIKNI